MLWVQWIWSHCHGLSTQDTSFRNPSNSPQTSQKSPCQIKSETTTIKTETGKANLRSQSHFQRHHSSSHHNSYRSCSRLQHWDRCSHHRSMSRHSCSTHRGHSHRPHHDTPHWSHCRSSQHRSSSDHQSQHHSRSHSWPSYRSSRHKLCGSSSQFCRTSQKPHAGRTWGWRLMIHTWTIIALVINPATQERNLIL